MSFNFSVDDAKKLLNVTFDIACDVHDFMNDIRFQSENREALQSGNAWNITYRLGRTEERYDDVIWLCDDVASIASKITSEKNPVTAPVMQMVSRQKYTECLICHKPVVVSISWQEYYWQLPLAPVKCYDCCRLADLTDRILIFSAIKKAQEKAVENVFAKSVDWLARQFGTDADEIRRVYYVERGKQF